MKKNIFYTVVPVIILLLIISVSPLSATDYYVDAINGSDSNSGLSTSTAWRTMGKVNNSMSLFGPGDKILFKRGQTFRGQGQLYITASGAAGDPVTFGAFGIGNRPVIDKILCNRADVGYVTVQDFSINNTDTGVAFLGNNNHNITISRFGISNISNNGIFLSKVDTYIIENCTISDCHNGGIGIVGSEVYKIRNGIIRNNVVGNITENDAISLHRQDITLAECGPNHLLQNNVCYNSAENGFDLTSGTNITLRGNETYGNSEGGTLCGGGIVTNVWIDRHYSHDDYVGIVFGGRENIKLTSSIIYNARYHQIILVPETGLTNFEAYHNTFVYGPNSSGLILDIGPRVSGAKFKNNIFISTQYYNPKTYVRFMDQSTPASTNASFDYNTYWRRDGDSSTRWNVQGNISFSTWQSDWGQDIHGQFIDPLFVSLSGGDFHLRQTSPCIDAGTSTSVSRDFEGTAIPQGSAPDAGAFEFEIATPPPVDPVAAQASASPQTGDVPLTVNFTGSATGGNSPYSYRWNFGDGQTSTAQNPSHTYSLAGTFTATLTVTDSDNAIDTASVSITVQQITPGVLTAFLTAFPQSGEAPLSVDFTGYASGGNPPYSYRWNFGDGQISTAQNPSYTYSLPGTFTAMLTVTDSNNDTHSASVTIQVHERASIPLKTTIAATPAAGVVPLSVHFSASASGGTPPYSYRWKFGNGDSIQQKDPVYTYTKAGTFHATSIITDAHNVKVVKSITIKASSEDLPAEYFCAPGSLSFGNSSLGGQTQDQHFHILDNGFGVLNWSVQTDKNWISCSPSSGTGHGKVTVNINPEGLSPGEHKGTITMHAPNAVVSQRNITITLKVYEQDAPPVGGMNTPFDGSHVSHILPVSGWALDDIEVERVEIKRSAYPDDIPEMIGQDGLVYLGEAFFLEDARPELQYDYPDYPMMHKAGWGYTLYTYQLPNKGNGLFTIHAIAYDSSGQRAEIGQRTITSDNASCFLPFGEINSPEAGELISGEDYTSSGWALTPPPKSIPVDGSTIWIWIDGILLGHPVYNQYRGDIASLFPEYHNAQGAGGYFPFDPTQFTNGVHTIFWSVSDDAGDKSAIDTVYFNIQNGEAGEAQPGYLESKSLYQEDETGILNLDIQEIRRGYILELDEDIRQDQYGNIMIDVEEMEPIHIRFQANSDSIISFFGWGEQDWEGLPMGSTLNQEEGSFCWIPTPGYFGTYTFQFSFIDGIFISLPLRIKVNIVPKTYEESQKKQRKIKR